MNLYEIDARIKAQVDPETGEILDFEAFQALHLEREVEIENLALWRKNLVAEAEAIRAEEVKLAERRRALERNAAKLELHLSRFLDGEEFSTARVEIKYRKSSAVEVEDSQTVAEWLEQNGHVDLLTYDAPKIDKRGVKDLLKQGVDVPGAAIVERRNMQIR